MRILPGAAFVAGAAVTALVKRAGGKSFELVDWVPILTSAIRLSPLSPVAAQILNDARNSRLRPAYLRSTRHPPVCQWISRI